MRYFKLLVRSWQILLWYPGIRCVLICGLYSVSPALVEPPNAIYADCDKIAITWEIWHPGDVGSDAHIGGYDINLKNESSDWISVTHVIHAHSSNHLLGYVISGLEPNAEYTINVSPIHDQSTAFREPIGPELIVNTLCPGKQIVYPL